MSKGRTPGGLLFDVPRTPDMIETLLAPQRWGLAEFISVLIISLTALSIFLGSRLPLFVYVLWFIFWRLSYNVGISLVLFSQSQHRSVTKFVQEANESKRSLLNWVATRSLPQHHRWASSPPELNAWLTFRAFALVVLVGDGASYIALAFACFQRPSSYLFAFPAFLLGMALIVFSVWAKKEAHDALGDYAWYWGDFFFLRQGSVLVLDGVFSLAPHPMYTIGYTAYYGAALLTRSNVLLTVSLFAHASQIAFLLLVEEPHMQRVYSNLPNDTPEERKSSSSSAEITPMPPVITPTAEIVSKLSSPYLTPLAVSLTFFTLNLLAKPPLLLVIFLAVVWRVIAIFLNLILTEQSQSQTWMRSLARKGLHTNSAYQCWKHLYVSSYFINHALFVCVALSVQPPKDALWMVIPSAQACSRISLSLSLLGVAFFIWKSAIEVIGEFGFCYGDFFLPSKSSRSLDGPYRYLEHPQYVSEVLAYVAVAIYRRSWLLVALAAWSHTVYWIFTKSVEAPHMRRVLKNEHARSNSVHPSVRLLQAVEGFFPFSQPYIERISNTCGSLERKATAGIQCKIAVVCEDVAKFIEQAPEEQVKEGIVGMRNLEKATSFAGKLAETSVKSADSAKILSVLRRFGMKIEDVPASAIEKVEKRHSLKSE